MDYREIINKLKDERRRLDIAIACLEDLEPSTAAITRSGNGRSGRPTGPISPEARQRMSDGMRAFWKRKKAAESQTQTEPVIEPEESAVGA